MGKDQSNGTIRIAPSILAGDFSRMDEELQRIKAAGADWIHLDVMDGHFVPNLTIGPAVVEALRPRSDLPFDVHLMIENPEKYVGAFARAGADLITFHVEAADDPLDTARMIRDKLGKKAGVALSPRTPAGAVLGLLAEVDLVLVMTVNPGFGGQKFIKAVIPKIQDIYSHLPQGVDLEVDGGLKSEVVSLAAAAGANVIVAGTAVMRAPDAGEAIRALRKRATEYHPGARAKPVEVKGGKP